MLHNFIRSFHAITISSAVDGKPKTPPPSSLLYMAFVASFFMIDFLVMFFPGVPSVCFFPPLLSSIQEEAGEFWRRVHLALGQNNTTSQYPKFTGALSLSGAARYLLSRTPIIDKHHLGSTWDMAHENPPTCGLSHNLKKTS